MKDFLDNFAAVVGAATLALLLFAVCHEYGYFSVIGNYFQPFVSTTDYFSNATQWGGIFFVGVGLLESGVRRQGIHAAYEQGLADLAVSISYRSLVRA
jgi:hypothetical protein